MSNRERAAIWLALLVALAVAIWGAAGARPVLVEPRGPAQTDVYLEQGGAKLVVASGGEIEIQSGGTIDVQSGATTDFSGGVDLDGALLDLDADGDTSLQADIDDVIAIEVGGTDEYVVSATAFAFEANCLELDADNDTSLCADTDDQIDIELAGADDFTITANNLQALNGSSYDLAAGADITHTQATNTGVVFASSNTFAVTDTAAKEMFNLPANVDVMDALLAVTTAFGTSHQTGPQADCGTQASPTSIFSSATVSTTGVTRLTAQGGVGDVGSSVVSITCRYLGDGSGGTARLTVFWRID